MHQRHLGFSRPVRTHAHVLKGALHKRTFDACAVSRLRGAGGGDMSHISRSTLRMADPGEG